MERHILFQSKRSQSHKSSSYVTDVFIITLADQAECPIEEIRLPERSWANIKGSKVVKSPREFLIYQQFQGVGFGLVQEFQRILPGPSFMLYSIVNKYHGTLETCHLSDTSMRLSNVSFRELEAAFKKNHLSLYECWKYKLQYHHMVSHHRRQLTTLQCFRILSQQCMGRLSVHDLYLQTLV